jgi:glycosyltransferase involved in cell wall biosynthesis
MVNCHSLSSLPLCVAIKKLHGATLIYEPHELETETVIFTGLKQKFAKFLEKRLIKHASHVVVVSDSISGHYRRDYSLEFVSVVMNAPKIKDLDENAPSLFRDLYGIPESEYIFMYQGVLEEERGVLLLLKAFQMLPPDKHIVFMGFGILEETIRNAAKKYLNIHIHDPVLPKDVVNYTKGVDIGFALLSDNCENHRCALPNKFFHYLHAGVPVLISDLHEMGRFVEKYSCGWKTRNTAENIVEKVMMISRADIKIASAGAKKAKSDLNWERESKTLELMYDSLVGNEIG